MKHELYTINEQSKSCNASFKLIFYNLQYTCYHVIVFPISPIPNICTTKNWTTIRVNGMNFLNLLVPGKIKTVKVILDNIFYTYG